MRAARVALLGVLVGCGYRLIQPAPPFGLTTIAVEPFAEEKPVGLGPPLTRALSAHLAADGATLSMDRDRAHGVLKGVILSASTRSSPTNAGSSARIPAYQISIQIQATLVDRSGAQLWQTIISLSEDFLPPSLMNPATLRENRRDPNLPLATDTERRKALLRLAERAARELHNRLLMASTLRPPRET